MSCSFYCSPAAQTQSNQNLNMSEAAVSGTCGQGNSQVHKQHQSQTTVSWCDDRLESCHEARLHKTQSAQDNKCCNHVDQVFRHSHMPQALPNCPKFAGGLRYTWFLATTVSAHQFSSDLLSKLQLSQHVCLVVVH